MKIYITDDDMCTTQKLNLARVQKWLMANGSEIVDEPNNADKILCMTCNGWSLLENASFDRIDKYKKEYADRMIVMGCVVDAHPKKVFEVWQGATVRTNSSETYSFSEIEKQFPSFKIKLSEIPAQSIFRRKEDYRDYNLSKRFINIAEGCAFHCSFCTHKPGLGSRRSRPINEILEQIKECIHDGVNIISLMGMETSMWGIEYGSNYAKLFKQVLEFNDYYQIHVAQFNASGVARYGEELLPLFQNKRVTDIQAPIQSTSTRLLKMMNRKQHSDKIGPFFKRVREKNTRVVLRTDLIIGWPTETIDERIDSLNFAGNHFDEVALYTIELSPDLPAWKYQHLAFSSDELDKIRKDSQEYLEIKFPELVVHSGQQDDHTMKTAEVKRINLHKKRNLVLTEVI